MKHILASIIALVGMNQTGFSEAFQTKVSTPYAVGKELVSCKTPFLAFKECDFATNVYTTTVNIPAEYASGLATNIEVHKTFVEADGKFTILINGAIYSLNSEAIESFPLPTGTLGDVNITLSVATAGTDDVPKSFKSYVKKIVVNKDGSAYVNSLLKSLTDDVSAVESAQNYYKLQRTFIRYFKKSDEDILGLREDLTGRAPDDLSNDCQKNGQGQPAPLNPEECQQLRIFNNYLTGHDTGISENAKNDAFDDFKTKTTKLETSIQILTDASISYDARYQTVLENASNLILVGG